MKSQITTCRISNHRSHTSDHKDQAKLQPGRKATTLRSSVCTVKREKTSRFTVSNHNFHSSEARKHELNTSRRDVDSFPSECAMFNPATLNGKVTGKKTKMRERKTLPFDLECNSQSKNVTRGFCTGKQLADLQMRQNYFVDLKCIK